MTQQLARQQPAPPAVTIIDHRQVPLAIETFGADRLDVLKEQIGRGWKVPPTEAELEHIALVCQRTRLDPLAKPPQIYFIQRFDKALGKYVMTPQVGIDGLRTIASRSRDYLTQAGPQWCGDDGQWRDIWTSKDPPAAARVGVVRRGTREPLWSVALWSEWEQTGLSDFWRKKPAHMLAKTAEAIALKRACPAETNELEIAHNEEIDRLEAPALVAMYDRLYGADEAHAFAEMPLGLGAPSYVSTRERDVDDQPRPQPERAPAPPPRALTRGDYLDAYSSLLTRARQNGQVADEHMSHWAIAAGSTDEDIIARGREIRALVESGARYEPPAETDDAQGAPSREDERAPESGDGMEAADSGPVRAPDDSGEALAAGRPRGRPTCSIQGCGKVVSADLLKLSQERFATTYCRAHLDEASAAAGAPEQPETSAENLPF